MQYSQSILFTFDSPDMLNEDEGRHLNTQTCVGSRGTRVKMWKRREREQCTWEPQPFVLVDPVYLTD